MNDNAQSQLRLMEDYRHVWDGIDQCVAGAFRYRKDLYTQRNSYPWRAHVAGFQPEVVHQVEQHFDDMYQQGEVDFDDRDGLFLLKVVKPNVLVKFAAIHNGGRPAMNKTGQASLLYSAPSLFPERQADTVDADEGSCLLAGYILHPAFESPPATSITRYRFGTQDWRFGTAPDEIERAIQILRQAV